VTTDRRAPEASSAGVRVRMQAQAQKDTAPEVVLRRALYRRGMRYRIHVRPVAGLRRQADIVFLGASVAVFVDGCWWHRCPTHSHAITNNTTWWTMKLAKNVARDRDTDRRLAEMGWTVVRVWEHDDPESVAERIARIVQAKRASSRSARPAGSG